MKADALKACPPCVHWAPQVCAGPSALDFVMMYWSSWFGPGVMWSTCLHIQHNLSEARALGRPRSRGWYNHLQKPGSLNWLLEIHQRWDGAWRDSSSISHSGSRFFFTSDTHVHQERVVKAGILECSWKSLKVTWTPMRESFSKMID